MNFSKSNYVSKKNDSFISATTMYLVHSLCIELHLPDIFHYCQQINSGKINKKQERYIGSINNFISLQPFSIDSHLLTTITMFITTSHKSTKMGTCE